MDGGTVAVRYLYMYPPMNPALAYRLSTLRQTGGFYQDQSIGADLITNVRVVCEGCMAYHPQLGAVARVHESQYSQTGSKDERRLFASRMYQFMLDYFEQRGLEWRGLLLEQLRSVPADELVEIYRLWIRRRAPRPMLAIGWQVLQEAGILQGRRLRRFVKRVGLFETVRAAALGIAASAGRGM
jgi:hypothetical protein